MNGIMNGRLQKNVRRARSAMALAVSVMFQLGAYAQPYPTVLTGDGAWTWYNDPRAMWYDGVLYFGYVRYSDGKTVLSAVIPQDGVKADLWTSTLSEKDDHNVPGLGIRPDGRMLAIYSRHNTDHFFSYRISRTITPSSATTWDEERRSADTGAGMTYANPVELSSEHGRIFDFARNLNFNPTVFTSTNGGTDWSAPHALIRTGRGSVRPYVKVSSDNRKRIDFLYTDGHPRDVANSLYHMYYEDGAFHKTDGAVIKQFADLPLLHDEGDRGSVIYQYSDESQPDPNQWIPTGRAWCWEIVTPASHQPACVFSVERKHVTGTNWYDDRIYYYYARWNGANWQKWMVAQAGRPLYQSEDDYAGGICIDPRNPNVIYISSDAADPFAITDTTNVPLQPDDRYEIWRGETTDGGLSFKWRALTTGSSADNLRPYVPRGGGSWDAVLWFRGKYLAYTNYASEVVGLFQPPPR